MRAEQSVLPPRCNQLAGSTDFRDPSGQSYLAEDARRGNHDPTTAGHPGNVGLIIRHVWLLWFRLRSKSISTETDA
jgi:hypothetical protein